jgi:hypothetical protein
MVAYVHRTDQENPFANLKSSSRYLHNEIRLLVEPPIARRPGSVMGHL